MHRGAPPKQLSTTTTYHQQNNKSEREEAVSMAKVKAASSSSSTRKRRPALTPEARENQMIALAVDLAEKQLMEGTASSQVITHFLKLGSSKAELEREKLAMENELIRDKTESIQSQKKMEEVYLNALNAMKRYSGHGDDDDY